MYDKQYFAKKSSSTYYSAKSVVPIVTELVNPKSVVDVGCGLGEWLQAFYEEGITDYIGVDGAYVDKGQLFIPESNFRVADLRWPLTITRTFDLAVCLEVAEHLSAESACVFIKTLIKLAPVVLFSAAIPLQGGREHVNEQWPEYWAELFGEHDYIAIDAIRRRIWHDKTISVWYRQNMFLFVNAKALAKNNTLLKLSTTANSTMLSVVHPELYLWKHKQNTGQHDYMKSGAGR